MSVKEINISLDQTRFEFESDSEQGVVHTVVREFNENFDVTSATGAVLTIDQLREVYYAIGEVIEHQKRNDDPIAEFLKFQANLQANKDK